MLTFFDAKCMIGPQCTPREGSPVTTEAIIELMDRCRITNALVFHSIAKEHDMMAGNHMLGEALCADARFQPQWLVMPSAFGEFPTPEALIAEMKQAGVRSVRIQPMTVHHSLRPYTMRPLMNALADCRIPVFLDRSQIGQEELYDFCTDYPANRIVLTEPGYRDDRYYAPILEACPNLCLGTSSFIAHNGLRAVCRSLGAERLIFETGLPLGSACAAVSLVCYADISREEKEQIARRNLEEMLSEVCL